MKIQLKPLHAVAPAGTPLDEFEMRIGALLETQRDLYWHLGDLSNAVERQYPKSFEQAYPVDLSVEMIDRCKAVAAAYKPHERNPGASWTIHMRHAKDPDRVAIVAAAADAGQTSDENRKNPAPVATVDNPVTTPGPEHAAQVAGRAVRTEPADTRQVAGSDETPAVTHEIEAADESATPAKLRWLLCVDINYYVHRQFQVEGMAAGSSVISWLTRVIDRLMDMGLSDVVCCFDGPNNHRREITKGWEQPYKERTEKAPELVTLLNQVPVMLSEKNILIVTIDGMEADDVMASYAKQFDGSVTLLTADKDLRQCLVDGHCNMLIDVTWEENPDTREWLPIYHWVIEGNHDKKVPPHTQKHMESVTYASAKVSGISPAKWPHFQAIAGDSVDKIGGVAGIGAKGAMDLILAHNTVQGVIEACKTGNVALTRKKIESVMEFEPFAEATLLLTTMRTDLKVPTNTAIGIKELIEKRS